MTEILVAVLIGFLILFCFYSLFFGSSKCGSCCGVYSRDDLLEILKNLPDNARIYISVDRR